MALILIADYADYTVFLTLINTPLRCATPGQAAFARLGVLDETRPKKWDSVTLRFLSELNRRIRHRSPNSFGLHYEAEQNNTV
jgi:hypothetical protein